MSWSVCSGCGLEKPATDGPTHDYVVSSPECWAVFSSTQPAQSERLLSDAYMVQHTDGDDKRQIQSVAVHLITLHAILGRGHDVDKASRITAAAVEVGRRSGGYLRLVPPNSWRFTIDDVARGGVLAKQYVNQVYRTWCAWGLGRVEGWTAETLDYLYR